MVTGPGGGWVCWVNRIDDLIRMQEQEGGHKDHITGPEDHLGVGSLPVAPGFTLLWQLPAGDREIFCFWFLLVCTILIYPAR